MRIDILTLFPEMFTPILGTSIPKRAAEKGLVSYHLTNIRDFATDAHKSVDDKPFGGGPGMVMLVSILVEPDAAGTRHCLRLRAFDVHVALGAFTSRAPSAY